MLSLGLGGHVVLSSPVGDCYCAFCKSPRKYFLHKNLRAIHYLQAALVSVFFMYAIWGEFEPKVFFIMATLLVATEIALHVRWRLYIVCTRCGFDPLLYLKDPEAAAKRVITFLDRYDSDPAYELLPNPKRNLHHRPVPALPQAEQ
jgi:hypothetical protein